MVGAGEGVTDRDMARGEVDQIGWDEKRRQAAGAALMQGQCAFGDSRKSSDPRTDHDACALTRLLTVREPTRVLYRLGRRSQRKDDKSVHLALVLGRYPIIGVEQSRGGLASRYLRSYLCRQVRHLEGVDRADPGFARSETAPIPLKTHTEGSDEPP